MLAKPKETLISNIGASLITDFFIAIIVTRLHVCFSQRMS